MPTNAASIAVLNDVTLGCRDLFMTLSTTLHSNPKDLNLGCWEARIPWTKTYWRCLRTNFDLNYEPMHRPAKKHMIFRTTVSIYGFITSIRTRNDCPRSFEISAWALSMTVRILAMRSCEWLFLSTSNSSLDYSKAVYFATTL